MRPIRSALAGLILAFAGLTASHTFAQPANTDTFVIANVRLFDGEAMQESRNVVVEDNAIFETGLGIFVRGSESRGNRIANNTITAGENGLLGICYNPTPDDPIGPSGDLVEGNLATGFNLGIQTNASTNNVFRGNTLFFKSAGFEFNGNENEEIDNTLVMLP